MSKTIIVLGSLLVILAMGTAGYLLTLHAVTGRPIPAPPLPSVGDTVSTMGITCTLDSVQLVSQHILPSPTGNQEFMVFTIHLTNQTTDKRSFHYSPDDFSIITIAQNGFAPAGINLTSQSVYVSQASDALGPGILLPDATIKGKLLFEVTKGSHEGTFYWRPQSLTLSKTGMWHFYLY